MSFNTDFTATSRPAAPTEWAADYASGEAGALSAFKSEADEAHPEVRPAQLLRAPMPDLRPTPIPAVRARVEQRTVTPNLRGPRSPAFLALPGLALIALGAAVFYAYAAPVRQVLSLPSVRGVFGQVPAVTAVSSLHLTPPEPAAARGAGVNGSITPSGGATVTAGNRTPPRAPRVATTPRAASISSPGTTTLPPVMGLLYVNARPWADVWVDGQSAGTTPLANLRVAVGAHEIVWRHPHLGERRQHVIVTRESPTRIGMNLQAP